MQFLNPALAGTLRLGLCGAFALAISGCSMGSLMGGGGAPQDANVSANPTEIAAASSSALPAIATECPPIKIRPGAEALFNYGGGTVGDPRKLQYQAVIEKQSRNCVVSNGLITVKMGVVGRLMLGPAGNQKSLNIPLRFAVERDNVALFSELYEIPVAISPPNQSAEFIKVVEDVNIPYLGGENIVIWVGFDPKG